MKIRNSQNIKEYLKLIHPKCLSHFSKEGKPDFPKNIFLAFRKRLGPTPSNTKVLISKANLNNDNLIYPIKPSHTFSVSWKDSNGKSKSISESHFIIESNTYYLVIPDYPK